MRLLLLMTLLCACDEHPIPERVSAEAMQREVALDAERNDPQRYLKGGERVFFDDFERAEIGPKWVLHRMNEEPAPDWRIENGWLRTETTKNQGLFADVIPAGVVRVEVVMKSLPPTKGRFAGDLKFEAFSTAPQHETGYVFFNGGWNNQFDHVAKGKEHSNDSARVGAQKVVANREYRYAAVRTQSKLFWFRDGELLYTFTDASPTQGKWLGLNNWTSNMAIGEVSVFKLAD